MDEQPSDETTKDTLLDGTTADELSWMADPQPTMDEQPTSHNPREPLGEWCECGLPWPCPDSGVGQPMDEQPSDADREFRSYASDADWDARCMAAERALRAAMVLLADADDKYAENLLDALYDSDDGFALDFYNRVVAGDAEVVATAPVISTAEVKRRV